jgi:hypothetical protein
MSNGIDKALRQVQHNLETLRKRWQIAMQQQAGERLAGRALAKLKTIPGKPHHPIRWSSERQRKAYFASDGFGGGIPSRRTGSTVDEWTAGFEQTSAGGLVVLSNFNPAVRYLQGVDAQPFHIDTGWVQIEDVEVYAHREMEDVMVLTFYQTADLLEGV